jgi:hypothetical protein
VDVHAAPGSAERPHIVWCVDADDIDELGEHRHVVALRATDPDGRAIRWTLVQAISAIRAGELFVVMGDLGTVLEPAVCPRCPQATLVSYPQNALDDLPDCS